MAEPFGRIRVREPQGKLLWDLLWGHYGSVINERWMRKQRGLDYAAEQRELALIETIKAELQRTAEEMGWEWVDGEPERADPQGTGPVLATEERQPVGRRT